MHRNDLLDKLSSYHPEDSQEKLFKKQLIDFVTANTDCFERSLQVGHVTGSAWIVNNEYSKALLTHHRKLNRWLQLGGHADGISDIIMVSSKEAHEESGLNSLTLVSSSIFDVDIHTIPARKSEQEHQHYDVRFLFEAKEEEPLIKSSESKDLAWISFEEIDKMTQSNKSIHRMLMKSKAIKNKGL